MKIAQGVRSIARQHDAIYLHRLDEHIQGKPWTEVGANDVTGHRGAMKAIIGDEPDEDGLESLWHLKRRLLFGPSK